MEFRIRSSSVFQQNAASVASNLRGVQYGHLEVTMAVEGYLEQKGHVFVLSQNPGGYPLTIVTTQYQSLGT